MILLISNQFLFIYSFGLRFFEARINKTELELVKFKLKKFTGEAKKKIDGSYESRFFSPNVDLVVINIFLMKQINQRNTSK